MPCLYQTKYSNRYHLFMVKTFKYFNFLKYAIHYHYLQLSYSEIAHENFFLLFTQCPQINTSPFFSPRTLVFTTLLTENVRLIFLYSTYERDHAVLMHQCLAYFTYHKGCSVHVILSDSISSCYWLNSIPSCTFTTFFLPISQVIDLQKTNVNSHTVTDSTPY